MKFKTIKNPSEGYYIEKKSKFYAFAYPVENQEEVKKLLKELSKKFYDARHIAYAFQLGVEKKTYRYSDDGEPNNTAGLPIYGVIKSNDLTNILIAVVRYFGGKKLGVSGLINAYRTSAEDAVKNAEIIEKTEQLTDEICVDYPQIQKVINFLNQISAKIIRQNFASKCFFVFSFDKEKKELVENFKNKSVKNYEKCE